MVGKNVEEIIKNVNNSEIKGVIGIIDADFKRILEKTNTIDNLFWTDYHDTEMMCIYSPAWENVLDFYIKKDKFEAFKNKYGEDFRTYLMKVSKPIGVLRLLNEKENLALKFKTKKKDESFEFLDYEAFTDRKTLKVDIQKLFKNVENKSEKPNFFKQNPNQVAEFDKLLATDFDLKELNNGHDLMYMTAVALLETIGSEKNKDRKERITGANLENIFTISYRVGDFIQTNLYQELSNWQKENIGIILFLQKTPSQT